jgi:beta-glucosidase
MGEDPYLTSKMVVPYIKGVQSNGVATSVKHFA